MLDAFPGTILLVTHDRYLIREVATHVWAIADGTLHVFDEGYPAYEAWRRDYHSGSEAQQRAEDEARARREAESQAQREQERNLARQQKALEELETQIHDLELRLHALTSALDSAGRSQDVSRVSKLGAEYHAVEAELNQLLEAWAATASVRELGGREVGE